MDSKRKHTDDELKKYMHMYLVDGISYRELVDEHGLSIAPSTFNHYVLMYEEHGISALEADVSSNCYSKEFKIKVVKEYLDTDIGFRKLARKYNIPSHSTVRNWFFKYTNGEVLNDYRPEPEVYTMNKKTTSYEDKLKIVKDCIDNELSYKDTAEKYGVSYTNVYSWVKKYSANGPDGLIDSRGRRKPESIQSNEEKLKTENAALKARNEYLETENAALKKLKEVERELMSVD